MARTDTLGNFVTDIANSIREKTGKTDKIAANQFDTEIKNIKYAPRRISFSYYNGTELDEEMANLDFKNITSAQSMFESCSSLKSLDLSNFFVSAIVNGMYGVVMTTIFVLVSTVYFGMAKIVYTNYYIWDHLRN